MSASPELTADLELARDAARRAGAVVMEYFRHATEVHFKAPDQPVTEADVRADRLLRETLLAARPSYGWLSEETADSPDRLGRARVWIVDPIDGTNSFVEGRPEFAVCVGLAEHGAAVVGVVYNPATDELYEAARGAGARRNGVPLAVPAPREGGERILASRSELGRGGYLDLDARSEIVPLGSTAFRMAKVADGSGDLFLSPSRKSEWDVCAAALVVEEAGGRVRQVDGGGLRYNQAAPVFNGVVAAGGIGEERLRELLALLGGAR